MILVIDSRGPKQKLYLYWENDRTMRFKRSWELKLPQIKDLIWEIDKLLAAHKVKLKDLKAIGVVKISHLFTTLRVSLAVANTLGSSLNIPVIGLETTKKDPAKTAFQRYLKLETKNFSEVASASYPKFKVKK